MDFKIAKTAFLKNPFIGLFLEANDEIALAPRGAPKKFLENAENALGVRVIELLINQSHLVGLFSASNSKGVLLPCFAEEEEIRTLRKEGLNVCVLSSPLALGNVVLANDKGALVSPLVPKKDAAKIRDCLGVEVVQQGFAGTSLIASASVVTNKGFLAHNGASDVELKFLKKIFGIEGSVGTSNLGTLYNALGVVANSRGALVGELTTGFEIQRIYEALAGE